MFKVENTKKANLGKVFAIMLIIVVAGFYMMPAPSVHATDEGCSHVCGDGLCNFNDGADYDPGQAEGYICFHDCESDEACIDAGACVHDCEAAGCDFVQAVPSTGQPPAPCDHGHSDACGFVVPQPPVYDGMLHVHGKDVKVTIHDYKCPVCKKEIKQYGPVDLYFSPNGNKPLEYIVVTHDCGTKSVWQNFSNKGAEYDKDNWNMIQISGGFVSDSRPPVDTGEGDPGEGDPGEGDPGVGGSGEGGPGEGDPGEGGLGAGGGDTTTVLTTVTTTPATGGIVIDPPIETISSAPIPLAVPASITTINPPLASSASWALLNLILTIVTGLIMISLMITYFTKRREDEEQEGKEEKVKKYLALRLITIAAAVVAIILFVLTQNMALPMIFIDQWTIWHVIITAATLMLAAFSMKKYEEEEVGQEV